MKKFYEHANINLRLDFLKVVIAVLFIILFLRMAKLTIIEGDKYREIVDQRRIRTIYESAPRGEIRDRHGRLLAGNSPSFSVQILKDELLRQDMKAEERNESLLKLIRFLEEDGVFFQGEFPIDLNYYYYEDDLDYMKNEFTPDEFMVEKLSDDNTLKKFLEGAMDLKRFPEHYKFNIKYRALYAVREKYIDIPVKLVDNEFVADEIELKTFVKDKKMDENLDAEALVFSIIKNDKAIMRKILDHPIARAILFKIVADEGDLGSVRMRPVSISYVNEGFINKLALVKEYPELSLDDSAEEVYLFLAKKYALTPLLKNVYKDGELVPGEILLSNLKKTEQFGNIEIYVSEDEKNIFYKYNDKTEKGDPLQEIIKNADERIVDDFLLSDDIRFLVQKELINNNINAKISVANGVTFISDMNTENLYSRFNLDDEEKTPENLLKKAKEVYAIDEHLSNYEVKDILNIYDLTYKLGESAYKPVNLAYGLKDETVAKIEENMGPKSGIKVSIEPVRYYPMGQTASHILGYMGRISSDKEVEKYVKENNYDKNDFIGKTGVEESFEDYLHGHSGEKLVAVDYFGNTTEVISESKAKPGDTLYLSIDAKLQRMAEEELKNTIEAVRSGGVYKSKWGDYKMDGELRTKKPFVNCNAGAVVALNAKTGEVLAMASYPGYDPNLFSTGISETDWRSFFPENDKDPLAARPLYNIATQTAVQPGSTFKMVTGFAGLKNGLNPFETIYDGGFVKIGDTQFNCLLYSLSGGSHGNVDLAHAIEHSCNYYFYSLALGMNQKLDKPISTKIDIDDIRAASEEFGLNDKTGIEINVPAETAGAVPEPEKKVATTKFYMGKYLEQNLSKFALKEKAEDVIAKDIKEIAKWAEEGRALSKNEIIRRLEDMGYQGDESLKGQRSLSDVLKYDYINQAGWSLADTLNVTIGQGQSHFTTLQMANYIATLVNGGVRNKVTIFDSVKSYDGQEEILKPEKKTHKVELENEHGMEQLKYGMNLVSNRGTSRRIFLDFPIDTGSKTGTAQREGVNPNTGKPYDDFGWFVSYAPYDDPEIVVATVLFQGGHGSNAGPLARDLMAEYLGLNREEVIDQMPFKNAITR